MPKKATENTGEMCPPGGSALTKILLREKIKVPRGSIFFPHKIRYPREKINESRVPGRKNGGGAVSRRLRYVNAEDEGLR